MECETNVNKSINLSFCLTLLYLCGGECNLLYFLLSRISTATFSREKRHKYCHFTFLRKTFLFASELKKSQLFAPFRWEENIQPMKIDFENRSRGLGFRNYRFCTILHHGDSPPPPILPLIFNLKFKHFLANCDILNHLIKKIFLKYLKLKSYLTIDNVQNCFLQFTTNPD